MANKSVVLQFLKWMLRPLADPAADDFYQITRKAFITFVVLMMVVPTTMSIWWAIEAAKTLKQKGDATGQLMAAITAFTLFLPWGIGVYVHVHRTRYASDRAMLALLLAPLVGMLANVIFAPTYPSSAVFAAAYIIILMTKPSLQWWLMALAGIGHLMATTNLAVLYVAPSQETTLNRFYFKGAPAPQIADTAEFTVGIVGGLFVTWLVTVSVLSQVVAYRHEVTATKAAVALSRKVVDHLCHYNTDAAKSALQAAADAHVVDKHLIADFKGITRNLEQYKPFLPNYMFLEDDVEVEATIPVQRGDEDGGAALASSPPKNPLKSDPLGHKRPGQLSTGGLSGVQPSLVSPSSLSRRLSRNSANLREKHDDDLSSIGSSVKSSGSFRLIAETPSQLVSSLQNTGHESFVTHLSWLTLDFSTVAAKVQQEGWVTSDSDMSAIVESIYTLANETKGSVHSLVGDALIATWNSVVKVAQPETKACLFVARICEKARKLNLEPPRGALASGTASCLDMITTSSKQFSLWIHLPWRRRLDTCLRLSGLMEPGSVIMDEGTESGVKGMGQVEATVVDAVIFPKSDSNDNRPASKASRLSASDYGSPSEASFLCNTSLQEWQQLQYDNAEDGHCSAELLFLVGKEIVHDEQEWMYQLHENEARFAGPALAKRVVASVAKEDWDGTSTGVDASTSTPTSSSPVLELSSKEQELLRNAKLRPALRRWMVRSNLLKT